MGNKSTKFVRHTKVWIFTFSVPVCLALILLLLQYSPVVKERKPHLLFILADDIGWNDVGYHNSDIRTPTIDQLANEGVKLENYYVQPLCTPSRSQLLSGRYQIHTGLQHGDILHGQPNALPLTEITVAEKLKSVGYSTHIVGKWHLGFHKTEALPTNRGFDSFYGILGDGDDQMKCIKYKAWSLNTCGIHLYNNTEPVTDRKVQNFSQLYSRVVENILSIHDKDNPIFLYLPLHNEASRPTKHTRRRSQFQNGEKTRRKSHSESMLHLDRLVQNITDIFKLFGLWDNTILIFSSDNGGDLKSGGNNWPLRGEIGTHWEGGIRAVGFVHSPLLKQDAFVTGDSNYELMHISDWYPTLLHLAGGSVEGLPLDGFNQWPTIKYKSASPRKEILHNIDPLTLMVGQRLYSDTFDNRITAAIRSGDWKLMTGYSGLGSSFPPPHLKDEVPFQMGLLDNIYQNIRLYNITADPTEHHELSTKHPEIVRQLLDKLAQYYENSVEVSYPPLDIGSSPEFHDGIWHPWIT